MPGRRVHLVRDLVVAITHVYETVFLLRDRESDRWRTAKVEQARLQTELESLGREVDPHFLFNNLNALAHLVEQRSNAALPFIQTLSATYRYVLECRGRTLVALSDELEALERHRKLADVRYPGGVCLEIEIEAREAHRWWLPPVSLPELFQNALKHNTVTADSPLRIHVHLGSATLIFENELRPIQRKSPSTGVGLANLGERFRIATGQPAVWRTEGGRFVVHLPLVDGARSGLPGSGTRPRPEP